MVLSSFYIRVFWRGSKSNHLWFKWFWHSLLNRFSNWSIIGNGNLLFSLCSHFSQAIQFVDICQPMWSTKVNNYNWKGNQSEVPIRITNKRRISTNYRSGISSYYRKNEFTCSIRNEGLDLMLRKLCAKVNLGSKLVMKNGFRLAPCVTNHHMLLINNQYSVSKSCSSTKL